MRVKAELKLELTKLRGAASARDIIALCHLSLDYNDSILVYVITRNARRAHSAEHPRPGQNRARAH